MKRLSLIAALLLAVAFPSGAELAEIGINPLRLEIGSRPLSMGAAFAGLSDDVNSVLYNPGGLAWAKGISVTIKDFENLTALQAYPTGFNSALGLAIVNSKFSDIPITGGVANSNSNVVLLSYGTKLSFIPALYQNEAFQRIGVGATVKALLGQTLRRTGLADRSATGWDADVGLLWKGSEWWSAGFSLQNILPGRIAWNVGEGEGVPAVGKFGAAAKIIGDLGTPIFMEGRELLLAGEIDIQNSGPALLRIGGEWGINKTYYFRTGVMQQSKPGAVVSSLNFGMGYRSDSWGADFSSYREPLRDEGVTYFSVLYFPKEWIVVRKLDVDRPAVLLEEPFEKISIEDNIETYDDRLEIFGKVKPGVDVYVNDLRAATADDNTFRVTVPLKLEKNLIVVEARYEGEKKTWKYKVLRKAKVTVGGGKKEELAANRQRVEELVTLGVIEVSPEAEFRLDASITRGELATWLAKATGLPLPRVDKDLFRDVTREHPLASYIKIVVDHKLLRPFPDGTFRPAAPVTKEEGKKLFGVLKKAQK